MQNNKFISEFNKAFEISYEKEYNALLALYNNKKINRTILKKCYGLSGSKSTAVLNFFDFIFCNDKDLINAKPNILSKIENNYLYKWFINFRDNYLKENLNEEKISIEEVEIEEFKTRRKYVLVTKEIVLKVKEMLSLNKKQKEIKNEVGISLGSIYRIKKGIYDYMLEDKQEENIIDINNTNEKENIDIIELNNDENNEKENIDIIELNNEKENITYIPKEYNHRELYHNNYIECGLIKNRHPIPVKLFIFNNSLLDNQILDYEYLDKIINNFIDKHINFDDNGKAISSLKVYTTGLQSALTSVIKICSERQIGLEILHYNPVKKIYTVQKVFQFDNLDLNDIIYLKKGYENIIYLYKCNINDLKNANEIYECKFIVYPNYTFCKPVYKESTLTNDKNKILEFYNILFSELLNKNFSMFISLRTYKKSDHDNLFRYHDQIIFTCNTSKSKSEPCE